MAGLAIGCGGGEGGRAAVGGAGDAVAERPQAVTTSVQHPDRLSSEVVQPRDPVLALGDAVAPEVLLAALPELAHLDGSARDQAVIALNLVPAPCTPCGETRLARCLLSPQPLCPNLPALVGRAERLATAGAGATAIAERISYPDAWVAPDLRVSIEPDDATRIRVELWLDPGGAFLDYSVGMMQQLVADDVALAFRFLPGDAVGETLSRGALAAGAQGRAGDYLRALNAARASGAPRGVALAAASAAEAGLDLERWRVAFDGEPLRARLEADQAAAPDLGVTAAPTWFVAGYRLRGAQSLRAVGVILEGERADRADGEGLSDGGGDKGPGAAPSGTGP